MFIAILLAYSLFFTGFAESKQNSKFENDKILPNLLIPKMFHPNMLMSNLNPDLELSQNPILLVYYQLRNRLKTQTKRCRSEGIWPHEYDCRVFIRCRYAPAEHVFYYQERTCPKGLAFDSLLESCNYIEQVTSCAQTITETKRPTKPTSIVPVYRRGELTPENTRREQDEDLQNHGDDDNDDENQPLAMSSMYIPELKSKQPIMDNDQGEERKTSGNRKHNSLQSTIKFEYKTTTKSTPVTYNKSSKGGKDCANQSGDNSNKKSTSASRSKPVGSGVNRASSRSKVGKKSNTTSTAITTSTTETPLLKSRSTSTRKPKVDSFGLPPVQAEPIHIEQHSIVL